MKRVGFVRRLGKRSGCSPPGATSPAPNRPATGDSRRRDSDLWAAVLAVRG